MGSLGFLCDLDELELVSFYRARLRSLLGRFWAQRSRSKQARNLGDDVQRQTLLVRSSILEDEIRPRWSGLVQINAEYS